MKIYINKFLFEIKHKDLLKVFRKVFIVLSRLIKKKFLNFILKFKFYKVRLKYDISNTWFLNSELKKNISKYLRKTDILKILEIGSYEGAASVFFSDKFLNNKASRLVCVDPHYESSETINSFAEGEGSKYVKGFTKDKFLRNIKKSKNFNKIEYLQIESNQFFEKNNENFNFIYIDGYHNNEQVKKDLINSMSSLQSNGVIWMDDYVWSKKTIDSIVDNSLDNFEVIHQSYQIAIKKIK